MWPHFVIPALVISVVRGSSLFNGSIVPSIDNEPLSGHGFYSFNLITTSATSVIVISPSPSRQDATLNCKRTLAASEESEAESRGRIYSKLDSNELSITPEDRLLRVAAILYFDGVDQDNWARWWATNINWRTNFGKTLSRAFFDFAYEARYGSKPSSLHNQLLRDFDKAYRKLHGLPAMTYDALIFAVTRGPSFAEVLSSYSESLSRSNRMKIDVGWKPYIATAQPSDILIP